MGNILQNSLDVTYGDFLKGVFGVKARPEWNALKTLFSEIVVGKSTLVSDMSKPHRREVDLPLRRLPRLGPRRRTRFWRDSARGRVAELSHANGGNGQNESKKEFSGG